MKYLDYLSFSQKSTTALRPTHSLFVTTLSPEITQNLQTFQMFLPPHTTSYQNNLYICETLPEEDEIKSLKSQNI